MYAVNHIPHIDLSQSTTGCCSLIHPGEWQDQEFKFDNKLFAKATTRSLFHIPLNMGSVMRKSQAKIADAHAESEDFLVLSRDVSPWKAEHYFAVDHDVPGMEMEKLSGTFLSKVFEGPYRDAGKWYSQMIKEAEAKGWKPADTFFFYTLCPNCIKAYGKNYVIGLERVERLKI